MVVGGEKPHFQHSQGEENFDLDVPVHLQNTSFSFLLSFAIRSISTSAFELLHPEPGGSVALSGEM